MPMNLILLERVPKLGQMGDVVKVKPGFARHSRCLRDCHATVRRPPRRRYTKLTLDCSRVA